MTTSGTYNFQSIEIELIIREAYENIGILGEFVESQKLDSAKRSLDLLFLEWMNKSVNLWTLKIAYLPLVTSQAAYILPTQVSDVVQVNLRTSIRQLNGTPTTSAGGIAANAFDGNSSTACTQTSANGNIAYDFGAIRQLGGTPISTAGGGVAANAFDGDTSTACTQTSANGNIGYDFGGALQTIDTVGIQTNNTAVYNIVIETSQDAQNWTRLYTINNQNFTGGQNIWFDIPAPISARAYRISAFNNSTLNIQEIFFSNKTGNSPAINFVGIQTNNTAAYNIAVEGSNDGITWGSLLTVTQNFTVGINSWFDIPAPVQQRYYRIRAFNNSTLNIQEIFLDNNLLDLPISNVSRFEYYTFPNKQLMSRPNCYYLDRAVSQPVLNIWPVPDIQYNCIQYSYKKMMEDTGDLYTNTVQIPSRFYPALIWGLSARLAIKFNPQIADVLEDKYEKSFAIASNEDSEHTPVNIYVDYEDTGY